MDNLIYYILIFLLKAIALLPLRALYVLSDIMCFFAHRVVKYRLNVVRKNLRNSFPEKSADELRDIEKKFYRHLCDCIVETVKLLHISDDEIRRRIRIHSSALVGMAVRSNRPIVLFMAHYANWEWVPSVTFLLSEPKTMGALYRPQRDKIMNRIIMRIRSRFDSRYIPARQAYRSILTILREHKSFMIAFIGDQRPMGVNIKHWTEFLGQDTSFAAGGETIGDKIGAKFLYLDVARTGRGYYSLTFKDMAVNPADNAEFPYTRLFFEMLEQTIRRDPSLWLWSHNRWKRPSAKN